MSVILLTTAPITCVLCVPLRSRLFFVPAAVSCQISPTAALCLPTEFPFACCCVLKPHPLLVLFLLLPARSCLERRWGLAHLRLWAPRLRRPWFTPLVGEAPVRPERFQGASSKARSRGQRVEEDTERQATQQREKEHGQQQCANTTSAQEYAPMQKLVGGCALAAATVTDQPRWRQRHQWIGSSQSLHVSCVWQYYSCNGPTIWSVSLTDRYGTVVCLVSLDRIRPPRFFPSFCPTSTPNGVGEVRVSPPTRNS